MSKLLNVDLIYNSVKEYPDMIQIIIYKEPLILSKNRYIGKRKKRNDGYIDQRSISRTRSTLSDLVICNKFDLFCTFTFDPKKYDRYNITNCRSVMEKWLRNTRFRHSQSLTYVVVPELHKDGAIHFHALLGNYNGNLKYSGINTKTDLPIYNLTGWRAGFSTATKIDNQDAAASYIKKYITKDMVTFSGKKRYFCSKGLIRPIKNTNQLLSDLKKKIPFYRYEDEYAEYLSYPKEFM